jgi:hypothetical protein
MPRTSTFSSTLASCAAMVPRMQASFSVGECVEFGWNEFKRKPAAYVLTTFVLLVAFAAAQFATMHLRNVGFLVGLVLGPMYWICNVAVARKGATGAEPTLNDAFRPFSERQGDYLMVSLAIASGAILCGIGIVVTWFLFAFSAILVLDGRDFKTAVIESKDLVLKHPAEVAILVIVLVALSVAGALACGVGTLVTTPISALAFVKAYEQLTRPGILPADLAPATPADPFDAPPPV